jgi:hypothetical protein
VSWDPGTESGIEDPGRHGRFPGLIANQGHLPPTFRDEAAQGWGTRLLGGIGISTKLWVGHP